MTINAAVPYGSYDVFILFIGNVDQGAWVSVPLAEPNIDHIDGRGVLMDSCQEVLRFDIAVEVVVVM